MVNLIFGIIPGGWEILVIIFALLLLFGGKKIPELMKGLGKGMKEFKKAKDDFNDEDDSKEPKKE